MIGLYDDDGNRLSVTFNGLTLNNAADDSDDTYELNAVITAATYDTTVDSDPSGDGAVISPARRIMYVVRLDGTVRAPTFAKLYDKKKALSLAFDPAHWSRREDTAHGFTNLDFSVPTEDTAEYASGLVPSRYVARSRREVVPIDSMYQGTSAFFTAELLIKDPRRTGQTLETRTGAGTATNEGDTFADATVTITMSGAGSATYAVSRTGDISGLTTLTLNLSGRSNGQVVTVDMANRRIYVDGTENMGLFVSGDYWDLDPGDNTIGITNGTNASTVISWRRSWVA